MIDNKRSILIESSERIWFRVLVYVQFAIVLLLPIENQWTLAFTAIVVIYTLRSPNIVIFEDGIQVEIFWQRRLIKWDQIKQVRITPKQILISEGWFPIPIFLFYWRANFPKLKEILKDQVNEIVTEYPFILPF